MSKNIIGGVLLFLIALLILQPNLVILENQPGGDGPYLSDRQVSRE
ncbi:MAG: hypothetical protein ACOX20_05420 [Limnochordia bacterium]